MSEFLNETGRPSATAVEVYNNTGTTMAAGTLVYINGFNTYNYCPTVGLADGTDATKPAQLVIRDPILSARKGWADTVALITAPNTASQTVGDTAYLSVTTAGGIQWTAPTAAGHQVQPVGICVKVAATGTVYFTPGISFETQLGSTAIPSGSVTNAKLASTAVTESKIVAGTITRASLGAGTLHHVKTAIGHANATPTIAVLPAGSLLIDAWTVCTETYNATAPTINIGYTASEDVILPTASIGKTATNVSGDNPSVRGTDLWVPGAQDGTTPFAVTTYGHARRKYYAASTTVIATIAGASGNTTGTMDVHLNYIQTV